MRPLFIALFTCIVLHPAAQQFAGLDTAIQRITMNTPFVGATILVAKGDTILHNKGYGYAHREFKVPATDSTRYWVIGNKNLTLGSIAMQLVEQGKFSLDDKISKHLKNIPGSWEPITIKHLITCTSGIPDYHYLGDRYEALNRLSLTQDEVMHRFVDLPLTIIPGSKYDWSISNFVVLNMIMEKTSGKTYQQLLKEFIAPLGITSTACFEPYKSVPNLAQGYAFNYTDNEYYPNTPSVFQYEPSGFIYSTPKDLFMIWRGMLNGKLISKASCELMMSRDEMNKNNSRPFGYLTTLANFKGIEANKMFGALSGASGCWLYLPSLDATIIVLSNSFGAVGQEADILCSEVALYLLGISIPSRPTEASAAVLENEPVSADEMNSLVGTYYLTTTLTKETSSLSYKYYSRTVRVIVENGVLKLQRLGNLPRPLLKQKDGTFRQPAEPETVISFDVKNGKAEQINIKSGYVSRIYNGKRVGDGDVKSFHEGLIK